MIVSPLHYQYFEFSYAYEAHTKSGKISVPQCVLGEPNDQSITTVQNLHAT